MTKPKVLIIVSGGVANYINIGDVDVLLIDEDNIDAGDPRVELNKDWIPFLNGIFDLQNSKYVHFTQ